MKKTFLLLILTSALLLVSCAKTATETPATAEIQPTPTEPTANAVKDEEQAVTASTFTDAATPCKPHDDLAEMTRADPNFPSVTDADWVEGPSDAIITLTVYDQFDCPGCRYFETQAEQLMEAYPEDFRLVFRHFFFHENADLPARVAEAAGRQNKFAEVKSFIFEDVENWYGKTGKDFEAWIRTTSEKFELDADKMIADFNDQAIIDKVAEENAKSKALGLNSTPSIYINGSQYVSPDNSIPGFELISHFIETVKKVKAFSVNQIENCPPMSIDKAKNYQITLTTVKGDILIDLNDDEAPYSVNAMVYLVNEGWYNDQTFYFADENYVVTGDPSGTRVASPGFVVLDELSSTMTFNEVGVVGMYHSLPGRNGSQFFITRKPLEGLESSYTVLGKVSDGLDVLNSLSMGDKITTVNITEK